MGAPVGRAPRAVKRAVAQRKCMNERRGSVATSSMPWVASRRSSGGRKGARSARAAHLARSAPRAIGSDRRRTFVVGLAWHRGRRLARRRIRDAKELGTFGTLRARRSRTRRRTTRRAGQLDAREHWSSGRCCIERLVGPRICRRAPRKRHDEPRGDQRPPSGVASGPHARPERNRQPGSRGADTARRGHERVLRSLHGSAGRGCFGGMTTALGRPRIRGTCSRDKLSLSSTRSSRFATMSTAATSPRVLWVISACRVRLNSRGTVVVASRLRRIGTWLRPQTLVASSGDRGAVQQAAARPRSCSGPWAGWRSTRTRCARDARTAPRGRASWCRRSRLQRRWRASSQERGASSLEPSLEARHAERRDDPRRRLALVCDARKVDDPHHRGTEVGDVQQLARGVEGHLEGPGEVAHHRDQRASIGAITNTERAS